MWPAQLGYNDAATAERGGILTLDLTHRPSQNGAASPRVTIYSPGNQAYATNTAATIEGPSSLPTLTQATGKVHAGSTADSQLALSSTTGIKARMRLLLGSADADRPEEIIKVRRVLDSTHLLTWGPLLYTHETGATLGGVRLTATIAAGNLGEKFRRGRAVWEWGSEGSATRDQGTETAVDSVRYPLRMLATVDGLRLMNAAWYASIPAPRDPLEIVERGWEEVGSRLYQKNAFGFTSSEALIWPTLYYGAWLETFGWGPKWHEPAAAWLDMADRMLERAILNTPNDPDENAIFVSQEQHTGREIRLERAN